MVIKKQPGDRLLTVSRHDRGGGGGMSDQLHRQRTVENVGINRASLIKTTILR